ncbi:MAG: hypothetical protein EA372_12015 [Chromatiaceae bacterium]|nr:MAG: hypothetical protein EA372_12015 [Chromatiaceae bacterium]
MKHLKSGLIGIALLALVPFAAIADDENKVLVTITSGEPQTQAMAMILTNQLLERGAQVNILLCDKGGKMGTTDYDGPTLKGPDATPQQVMQAAINNGANAYVCALFLPNSDYTEDDLIDGVGVATPPQMGEFMIEGTRFLAY